MRPLIGISCAYREDDESYYSLRTGYVEAVEAAGGLPLLIPCTPDPDGEAYARALDGLLLAGGGDIDPVWYGEEPIQGLGRVDPVADRCEIELCRRFLEDGRPVFGICRGLQVLNVAAGGDLFQDLRAQLGARMQHRQRAPRHHASHTVELIAGSLPARLIGREEIRVNSFHHQAVRTLGEGLRAAGYARDGVIEAIEGKGAAFVLGVQWHPECRFRECDEEMALFRGFVEACKGGRTVPMPLRPAEHAR